MANTGRREVGESRRGKVSWMEEGIVRGQARDKLSVG
jgi:hypothetical protein